MAESLMSIRHLILSEYSSLGIQLSEPQIISILRYFWKSLSPEDISSLSSQLKRNISFFPEIPKKPLPLSSLSSQSKQQSKNNKNKHKNKKKQSKKHSKDDEEGEESEEKEESIEEESEEEEDEDENEDDDEGEDEMNENIKVHKLKNCQLNPKIPVGIPVINDYRLNSYTKKKIEESKRFLLGKKLVAAQLSKQFTPLPVDDSHIQTHISPVVVETINKEYSKQSQKLREYSNLKTELEIQAAFRCYQSICDDGSNLTGKRRYPKKSQLTNENQKEEQEEEEIKQHHTVRTILSENKRQRKKERL